MIVKVIQPAHLAIEKDAKANSLSESRQKRAYLYLEDVTDMETTP
jgi:hypothetical protein